MKRTITWVLYILMGVQIVFGCAYIVSNFGVEQQFRENIVLFLPAGAVSLIQLVLACVSVWYALGKLGFRENKYVRGYVCAFLLTVPFLLQMHMARLIWSVAFSIFLWLLGLILETLENGLSGQRAALLFIAWLLYGILCPDGLWLGGILLFMASFFYTKREGKNIPTFRFALLLAAGVIFLVNSGLNNAFPEARRAYRENNLGTAVVSRFVWPNFGSNYFFWSWDVKQVLTEEEAVEIGRRVNLIEEEFYPLLEETYGRGKATRLCLEMGYRCLKDRTKETVTEIGSDLKDYFLLPFTIEKNLKGEGGSLTGWNYGRMREHTPILVKYYYRYGIFELPFLLLGSFLLWSFRRGGRIGQYLGQLSIPWRFLLFIWIIYTFWYTMRSNLPVDYKMALPILFIWYLASVGGLLCQKT